MAVIMAPFSTVAPTDDAKEITTRAQKLAEQVNQDVLQIKGTGMLMVNHQTGRTSFDHTLSVGGEESYSEARRSGEIRRSTDIRKSVEVVSKKIVNQFKKGESDAKSSKEAQKAVIQSGLFPLGLNIHYLLISPILPPISTLTALPFGSDDTDEDYLKKFQEGPALVVFGSRDVFTSSRRLVAWCEERRQANEKFDWFEIPGAGHFWHERGSIEKVNQYVREWIHKNIDG
jgi:hypothetical protein